MSGQTSDYFLHEAAPDSRSERSATENAQRATLNILEDFAAEKCELEDGQRATLNILEDFDAERKRMAGAERAVLNILEDFATEKSQLEEFQHSFLNILDDFSQEKKHLEGTQRAVLNILEDFEGEKANVELANERLERESEERKRADEEVRRTNRELSAANKELEAFSYSVSHDLRTPLRSIDGFSQALLEDYADKLDATGQDQLQRVRRAAQRVAALIDDILNLSRVTRCELRREKLDLSAMAKSIASELQKRERRSASIFRQAAPPPSRAKQGAMNKSPRARRQFSWLRITRDFRKQPRRCWKDSVIASSWHRTERKRFKSSQRIPANLI